MDEEKLIYNVTQPTQTGLKKTPSYRSKSTKCSFQGINMSTVVPQARYQQCVIPLPSHANLYCQPVNQPSD